MRKHTIKLEPGIRANDKIYNSWLKNRADKIEAIERLDNIIKKLIMSDAKREELKNLRGNSCRYTSDEIKQKALLILNK